MTTLSQIFGSGPTGLGGELDRSLFQPRQETDDEFAARKNAIRIGAPTVGSAAEVKPPVGALGAVGNILDLPGSSVRDVLALKNPFDQWLTPTRPENRTTGRDLLRQYGAAGDKDNWGNFGAGMSLELALDPLTYTGVGALTKAGTVAGKAGLASKAGAVASKQTGKKLGSLGSKMRVTPRQLIDSADDTDAARKMWADAGGTEELLDQPFQSLATFRVPGLMKQSVDLTSGVAIKSAASLKGLTLKVAANLPAKASEPIRKWVDELPDDLALAVGDALDKGGSLLNALPAVRTARAMFSPRVANATTELGQDIGAARSEAVNQAIIDIGTLFAPVVRTIHESKAFDKSSLGNLSKQDQLATMNARHAELDSLLDGSLDIESLSPELKPLGGIRDVVGRIVEEVTQDATQAGIDVKRFDTSRGSMSSGLPGIVRRTEDLARATGMARATTELLGRAAQPIGKEMGDGWRNLNEAVTELGLNTSNAKKAIVEYLGPDAITQRDALRFIASDDALNDLAFGGKVAGVDAAGNPVQLSKVGDKLEVSTTLSHLTGKQSVHTELLDLTRDNVAKYYDANSELLRGFAVRSDLLADAARFVKPFVEPEVNGFVRQSIQSFLNLFKQHVTLPFPSFHFRNLVSGQMQNVLNRAYDPTQKGPMRYSKPLQQAYQLRDGKVLTGIAADVPEYKRLGLSDKEATLRIADEAFARQLVSSHQALTEFAGDVAPLQKRMPGLNSDVNPLTGNFNPAPAGTTWLDAMNPLSTDTFLPTRIGGDVAGFVEDLNRLSGFIAYRKQGFAPDEATKMVNRAQVDYGSLTDWERRWGKLAVPFYVYSSRMIPAVVDDIVRNPGGRTANIVKVGNRATSDLIRPDYLAEQLLLPVGQDESGVDKYLGGFGLALEDAIKPIGKAMQGDASGLVREVGSRLNPLLKFPIELATGRSLFFGDPRGNPAPVSGGVAEQALANSPAARYVGTAKKLVKKGKVEPLETLANLITGLRLDEVSPWMRDSVDRSEAERQLRDFGGREFTRTYIPKSVKESLTPMELQQVKALEHVITPKKSNKIREALN